MNQIAIMELKIEVLGKQVDDLKKDLALNASMLARQCDLAREAETQALRLRCCGNCVKYYEHKCYCFHNWNPHKYCHNWTADRLTREEREKEHGRVAFAGGQKRGDY